LNDELVVGLHKDATYKQLEQVDDMKRWRVIFATIDCTLS
jgi:hypothetical protein